MNRYKKANAGIHAPEELKRAVVKPAPRRKYTGWVSAVAAVLVLAVVAGVMLWPGRGGGNPTAMVTPPVQPPILGGASPLAQAVYPETVYFPYVYADPNYGGDIDAQWDSWEEQRFQRLALAPERSEMKDFYAATMAEFLGSSGGENRLYSPLNVYMGLAMLAETCDGESRQQILDLLGQDSIEDLRKQASDLWNSVYRDDGIATTTLASSLWINEDQTYVQETLDRLAETYYASSYQGEMGSEEMNAALQSWLNEQTGGILEDYAGGVTLPPDTVLALASTLYFQCCWERELLEENTRPGTFHGTAGDVEAQFMFERVPIDELYYGDRFTAYPKMFSGNDMQMWFLLPNEGVSVEELMADSQIYDLLADPNGWENMKSAGINLYLPRFDVSSRLDLKEGLKNLGVTDVFDAAASDFSPLTPDAEGVYVSGANHATRVSVDEKGCPAAAVIDFFGGDGPGDIYVDFVLDRPFLFVITDQAGNLLFTGVINQV